MEASVLDEDGSGPVRGGATRAVAPLVRFVERLFGPGVPGFNFSMGVYALIWAVLMIVQPETFATGRFAGMHWLPGAAWVFFFSGLALLHGFAFWRSEPLALRITADLLSAWIWLSVAASFLRIELRTGAPTPGTFIYIIMGVAALCHGIYSAGPPRNGG